jgi:hypothetical protein
MGMRLGDDGAIETDAFLLGHTIPGSGKITLSKAVFMPTGVWTNTLGKVQRGKWRVLETYAHAGEKSVVGNGKAHRAAYDKLVTAYDIMRRSCYPVERREEELTKRWRVSKGPMTQRDRGAVWEGWGVWLDRGIEMGKEDRVGAVVREWIVDEGVVEKVRDEDEERRRREIEALLEEDEEDNDEDEDMMEI